MDPAARPPELRDPRRRAARSTELRDPRAARSTNLAVRSALGCEIHAPGLLGAILGPSWGQLGPSWGYLGPFINPFKPSFLATTTIAIFLARRARPFAIRVAFDFIKSRCRKGGGSRSPMPAISDGPPPSRTYKKTMQNQPFKTSFSATTLVPIFLARRARPFSI